MNWYKFLLALSLLFTLSACEKKVLGEAHKVHYDRDMCDECKMVVSDRAYVAQVLHVKKDKAYNFDDIGCAILWMSQNQKKCLDDTKLFVADASTHKFIDANTAFWTKGHTTPMDFGFAAYEVKPAGETFSFEEVKKSIRTSKNAKSMQGGMKCGAGKCGANE